MWAWCKHSVDNKMKQATDPVIGEGLCLTLGNTCIVWFYNVSTTYKRGKRREEEERKRGGGERKERRERRGEEKREGRREREEEEKRNKGKRYKMLIIPYWKLSLHPQNVYANILSSSYRIKKGHKIKITIIINNKNKITFVWLQWHLSLVLDCFCFITQKREY